MCKCVCVCVCVCVWLAGIGFNGGPRLVISIDSSHSLAIHKTTGEARWVLWVNIEILKVECAQLFNGTPLTYPTTLLNIRDLRQERESERERERE